MRFAQEISVFNPFAIEKAVIGLNTSITQTSQRISLQAEQIAVIDGKVETATAELSVMAEEIASKVENSTFTSSINQLSNQISSEVTARQNGDSDLSSRITQNATAITSKVSRGDVVSVINQSADQITISSNRIKIDSTYFHLTTDGQITATRGIIGNPSASSSNRWTIGGDTSRAWIYSGSKTNVKTSVPGVYIGTNGIEIKQSTGNTGNVTRIDGDGVLTTYIEMYDSGLQKSTLMYLDDRTDYGNGVYRMLFARGIATGYRGVTSADNWFYNMTHLQGGYDEGSDRRIKTDISRLDVEKAKAFIKGLEPSQFRFTNRIDTEKWHHGFVAQDVEKVAWDGLISGEGEELKGISYTEIIADIVAVLQDLLGGAE